MFSRRLPPIFSPVPRSFIINIVSKSSSHDSTLKKIQIHIPQRIQRGSTDILYALSCTVKRDPTAAHYKYHDDPYLIPTSNIGKRTFAMAQEAGRKAAKWIVQEHPVLFQHTLSDPPIEAFAPKPVYNQTSDVREETLQKVIVDAYVSDAIIVYKLLQQKGVSISAETLQSLLELVCFYNGDDALPEELVEERWFRNSSKAKERMRKTWKNNGEAETLFRSMENPQPAAYSCIIQAMIKYCQIEKAWSLYQESKEKGISLDTGCFNSLINATVFLKEGHELRWKLVQELLHTMSKEGLQPDLGTLNAVLYTISTLSGSRLAPGYALSTISEFQRLGIEPSLGSYYYLLITFCPERGPKHPILMDIMDEIDGKEFDIRHTLDTYFFVTAMDICRNHLQDKELATRVHNLLHTGNNYNLIGDSYKESIYYRHYFVLMCVTEPLEKFMEIYNRIVPHIYIPEPGVIEEVIKTIDLHGAGDLLPRIWSDMITFDHTDRENLLVAMLSALVKNQPADNNVEQNMAFANIAWDIWTKIEEQRPDRVNRLSWSAQMLADILVLCIRAREKEKAIKVFRKLDSEMNTIIGEANVYAFCCFLDFCIENEDGYNAMKCLEYCLEMGYPEAVSMAKEIKKKLSLDEDKLKKLTTLIDSDMSTET